MPHFTDLLFAENGGSIFTAGLLLPAVQEHTAVTLHEHIKRSQTTPLSFSLNTTTHPPYIRLYETVLPTAEVTAAVQDLSSLAKKMVPFEMRWGSIEQTSHFVAVWGESNPVLSNFQKAVLYTVNAYRDGFFKHKYIEAQEQQVFTRDEELSLQHWGSPWAEPYIPHMILAKAHPHFSQMVPKLGWGYNSCKVTGVFIGTRTNSHDFLHHEKLFFSSE